MKSCPKCNRTFPDDGQKFCTFDGGLLIVQQTFDPNATIRATAVDLAPPPPPKPPSRELPDQSATIFEPQGSTIALPRNTSPASHQTSDDFETVLSQAPPPFVPPTPISQPAQQHAPPPPIPTPLGAVATPPAKKKSKLPWIIAAVLVVLFLGGAGLVGAFFFVVKPWIDAQSGRPTVTESEPPAAVETNSNSNTLATTPPTETNANTDAFTPPANSEKFINSKANLDGKLVEHYFDFSFYYPKSWQMDPKAGVPGASNFVKVERSLPPDFTQENFAVGWYTSEGTFVGDLPNYPRLVDLLSANLSKNFPEYKKVSEGPTKINSMDAYEFRFESQSKGTEKGDIQLWGRVVFLPPGTEAQKTGATLIMLSTSLAPELSGIDDVGAKGEMPVILDSFRFGAK